MYIFDLDYIIIVCKGMHKSIGPLRESVLEGLPEHKVPSEGLSEDPVKAKP